MYWILYSSISSNYFHIKCNTRFQWNIFALYHQCKPYGLVCNSMLNLFFITLQTNKIRLIKIGEVNRYQMTVKFECIELSRLVNNLMFCDLCHRYEIRGNGFGIRDWIWLHLILFVHKFKSCDMFMCSLRCVCAWKDSVHIPATITYQIYVELLIQQFPWISVSSIYSTDSRTC